ncbi:MAG: HEXXH motif-containing putative peptide modification protein [Planctomycetota bacterium]
MLPDTTGFSLDDVTDGQRYLAHAMKRLVDKHRPDLFECLDLNNDAIFLEPLLFAYFNHPSPPTPLDQILFGYISDEAKPSQLQAKSDANGVIHLPGLGYFHTDQADQHTTLERNAIQDNLDAAASAARPSTCTSASTRITGTDIELSYSADQLYDRYYTTPEGESQHPRILHSAVYKKMLSEALAIIREHCPQYFSHISQVARRIVLFNNPAIRPFSTLSAHGTVFISSPEEPSVIFLVAEIIHQFGHTILNSVLCNLRSFFNIDPNALVKSYVADRSDGRTILSAVHGLYTTTKTAECLSEIYDRSELVSSQRHELVARLADNRDRVNTGIDFEMLPKILTVRGQVFFATMMKLCREIYSSRTELLYGLDTSNQPFVFDYTLFIATNPHRDASQNE